MAVFLVRRYIQQSVRPATLSSEPSFCLCMQQADEVFEDIPVRREIYNDLQHQYHIFKSSLIRGFRRTGAWTTGP